MYKVILEDKSSEIVTIIKEFFEMSIDLNCNFISILCDNGDINNKTYYHDNKYGKFENLDISNRINGPIKFSEHKNLLMWKIIEYSKLLVKNNNPNIEFDSYGCLTIEMHSIIAPTDHPFVKNVHKDSEEYGINTFSVLYYFDIDENVKNGELVIMDPEGNKIIDEININPENEKIKILLLDNDVPHRVNKIEGEGRRNLLCLFLGLND